MAAILFHDPRLSAVTGGGETVTLQLISLLIQAGHEVSVVTKQAPRSDLFQEALERYPELHSIEVSVPELGASEKARDHGAFRNELWESDRLAPESISFNSASQKFYEAHTFDLTVVSFVLDLAYLPARGPVLLNVFGLPPDASIASLERPLLARCAGFTFASHYVQDAFRELFSYPQDRQLGPVIHAGIHDEFFTQSERHMPRYDICYAGRLVQRKGVDVILKAVAWLKATTGRAVSAVIAGDGPERDSLGTLATDLGIADQITWLGAVGTEQLVEVLDQSRTFAYPTLSPEAFGCSNLEAMARGVPVITTNLGGTVDYVQPDINALVCEPKSPESLGRCLLTLLENPQLAEAIGQNGRSTAKQFHPREGSARWLRAFGDLLHQAV